VRIRTGGAYGRELSADHAVPYEEVIAPIINYFDVRFNKYRYAG
jgi:hypothetical protein